ncbi:MAG: hypothetical protein IVW36_12390 [Dehalococcoidia bacterium]|nr:hypothetical protein [Dehalococcoidia bacterium]
MGFTLNGNTSLVIVAALAFALIIAITAIILSGHQAPEIFTVVLAALSAAAGGGAAVNHVNQHDTGTIATNAAQQVIDTAPPATKTP